MTKVRVTNGLHSPNMTITIVVDVLPAFVKLVLEIFIDNGNMVTVIHNRPTQQQLADMSGTTRETVSRICSMLVRANAIAMTGKDIVIFDEDALQEKATKG